MRCPRCNNPFAWSTETVDMRSYQVPSCSVCGHQGTTVIELNDDGEPVKGRIILDFDESTIDALMQFIKQANEEDTAIEDDLVTVIDCFASGAVTFRD